MNNCIHKINVVVKIEDAQLNEPQMLPRQVKIKLYHVRCDICKKIFKSVSTGVVHDPYKNIYLDEKEQEEYVYKLNDADRELITNTLIEEGININ